MEINGNDLTRIISTFEIKGNWFVKPIKEKAIETEEGENVDISNLLGYTIKQKKKGDHKNDYQIVDYTFISPNNKKTELNTSMCLVNGWDFGEITYKIK